MAAKSYRPSKEDREGAKVRMAEAKGKGISFDDFFEELLENLPKLKKATAYGWWHSTGVTANTKSDKPKAEAAKGKPKGNPSERLANLLRKEGTLQSRVVQAREELKGVQADIKRLWKEREKQITDALTEE